MLKKVDARGLSCPQPALLAKRAIEEAGGNIVEVWVDTKVARDNVARFAKRKGLGVTFRTEGSAFIVEIAS